MTGYPSSLHRYRSIHCRSCGKKIEISHYYSCSKCGRYIGVCCAKMRKVKSEPFISDKIEFRCPICDGKLTAKEPYIRK
jgi:predicted RNA-binding Zn-ribbon protein involved in translation (DUF1610 family)